MRHPQDLALVSPCSVCVPAAAATALPPAPLAGSTCWCHQLPAAPLPDASRICPDVALSRAGPSLLPVCAHLLQLLPCSLLLPPACKLTRRPQGLTPHSFQCAAPAAIPAAAALPAAAHACLPERRPQGLALHSFQCLGTCCSCCSAAGPAMHPDAS
jgi:hypothetical protein